MKKYKLKNKNLFMFIIPIIIILLVFFIFFYKIDERKLKSIGYSEYDIKVIVKKSKEELEIIKENKYLNYLTSVLENENYKSNNLANYIELIEKNKEANLDTLIYMVNNNISYEYSIKLENLINHKYFILSRLDRYMKYDSDDIDNIIISVNADRDYKYYTNTEKTDTSKGILILVNKYHNLDEDYKYGELVTIEEKYSNNKDTLLNQEAYENFKHLVDDAEKDGLYIRNNYSYRTYDYQQGVYDEYKRNYGQEYADKYAARPGFSEHQTGLTVDVGVRSDLVVGKFAYSKEFTWMKNNSYKYGFILRYPEGKENITGYNYEAWHYRYVGVEAATYIYENNITFEEYYAYFIKK